jgi:hypothetical protein
MQVNPTAIQLLQMIQKGANPQQLVISMLEQQSANNPMIGNLLNLAKKNDNQGIEQVARNIMSSQGKDFEKEFNDFKNTLGL